MNDVLDFIKHFHGSEETFLHGCYYWFAVILEKRFIFEYESTIFYEPVEGHFVTRMKERIRLPDEWTTKEGNDHYYDVRGDVTELYQDKELYDIRELRATDRSWYNHLMRDCRDLIRPTDEELECS